MSNENQGNKKYKSSFNVAAAPKRAAHCEHQPEKTDSSTNLLTPQSHFRQTPRYGLASRIYVFNVFCSESMTQNQTYSLTKNNKKHLADLGWERRGGRKYASTQSIVCRTIGSLKGVMYVYDASLFMNRKLYRSCSVFLFTLLAHTLHPSSSILNQSNKANNLLYFAYIPTSAFCSGGLRRVFPSVLHRRFPSPLCMGMMWAKGI